MESDSESKISQDEDHDDDHDDDDKLWKQNPGWADAMAKLLKQTKPSGKKTIVLSRAKKLQDVKEEKPKEDFEIVRQDDQFEEEEDKKPIKRLIKEYQAKGRIKPDILDKEREKMLTKIATRGVVQLFNAVRQQQKTVEKTVKKAGKSERKREKLLENINKQKFIEVLNRPNKKVTMNEVKSEDEDMENNEDNTWSVLSDNFMMGTKLKDWDRNEEDES